MGRSEIERRVAALDGYVRRAEREDTEERTRLLAARPDLSPQMRAELASKPLFEVTRYLALMPDPKQGRGLQGAELAEYNRQARKSERPATKTHEVLADGTLRLNSITPSEYRALLEGTRRTRIPIGGSR